MKRQHKLIIVIAAVGFVLWAVGRVVTLYADWLWFGVLGYADVFETMLWSKVALGGAVFAVILGWLLGHAALATRLSPGRRIELTEVHPWFTPKRLRQVLRGSAGLVSAALGLAFAMRAADFWFPVLQFLNRTPFDHADPIFGYDAGFYVFTLPVLGALQSLLLVLAVFGLVAAMAAYFVGGAVSAQYVRMTRSAMQHVAALGALLLVTVAWGYWLDRFQLIYTSDPGETVFGAGYTDVHIRMPMAWVMVVVSVAAAGLVVAAGTVRRPRLALGAVGLVIAGHVVLMWIAPALVQRFHVQPNELDLEVKYIEHNIVATRTAFGIEEVEVREYGDTGELTAEEVEAAKGTIKNIRLWDYRVLRDTYREFQGLRTYYRFNQPDVDRYHLDGEYRQVSVAVRELDQTLLDRQSQTWVNLHLLFTHGYGPVMNPVNRVEPSGGPKFWVQNIPPEVAPDVPLAVPQPRIYFGEYTYNPYAGSYVLVNTADKEFDYPLGDDNRYNRYDGPAGVPIAGLGRKLLFAYYFGDLNILLSGSLQEGSRVLWDRDIGTRVRKLAHFLRLESRSGRTESLLGRPGRSGGLPDPRTDPYPVLLEDRVVWILDAYTETHRFPYSSQIGHTDPRWRRIDRFPNYIRNAVKIVVDAWAGTVDLYVADPDDPLIRTVAKIFPGLLKPLDEMPAALRRHLRYPIGLFNIQADRYMLYHMTDPKVFYNKEDLWERPQELYWSAGRNQNLTIPVASYYVIMTLPGEPNPEYVLMLPFTPLGKKNMVGWMAGRCDGEHYGKLRVYRFPKDRPFQGPQLVEARIDKSETISQQITLWDQMGSRVIRGNLLVYPIGNSVLYVEPLYLDSEQTPFPELKRVIVATKERMVMRETLAEALAALFGEGPEAPPLETPPTERPPVPETLAELAARAQALFEEALRQQREGDWAGYGKTMRELGTVIERLSGEGPSSE